MKNRMLALMASVLVVGGACLSTGNTCVTAYANSYTSSASSLELTKKYVADEDSVTVYWNQISNASYYEVYLCDDDEYNMVATTEDTEFTFEGLSGDREHSVSVRPVFNGYNGDFSEIKHVVTKPMPSPVITLDYIFAGEVGLSWEEADCLKYYIYAYDYEYKTWSLVYVTKDCYTTEVSLKINEANEGCVSLENIRPNALGIYRFAIKTYSADSDGVKKMLSKPYSQEEFCAPVFEEPTYEATETYSEYAETEVEEECDEVSVDVDFSNDVSFDVEKLFEENSEGLEVLSGVKTSKSSKSKSSRGYEYRLTTTENGETKTKVLDYTISDTDYAVLKAFDKKYFKKDWTKAQKLLFTAWWINQNVQYDYSYDVSSKVSGFAERIFSYKTGQCDAYNGALVEMMIYLGYKNAYLQWWDAATGGNQHARAFIEIDGKTYSFEDGNDGKYSGWFWFCKEDSALQT